MALLGATQPVLADINPPYPELLDLGEPLDSGYYTDSSQEPPLLEPPYPGLLENDKDTSERGTNQSSGHDNGDNVHRPELPPLPESPWPDGPFNPKRPSISENPKVDDYQKGFEDGRKAKSSPYGLDYSRFHGTNYSDQYKKGYRDGYLS